MGAVLKHKFVLISHNSLSVQAARHVFALVSFEEE